MAWEIGASFKILGTDAYFVGMNEGISGFGENADAVDHQAALR
ncbi:MAG: hypothetical protein U5N27_08615 [Rhizobium sp.]|nr:hypothetical protein [Rhizobium sp.]